MEKTYTLTFTEQEINNLCAGLAKLYKSLGGRLKCNERLLHKIEEDEDTEDHVNKLEFRINYIKFRRHFIQGLLGRLEKEKELKFEKV